MGLVFAMLLQALAPPAAPSPANKASLEQVARGAKLYFECATRAAMRLNSSGEPAATIADVAVTECAFWQPGLKLAFSIYLAESNIPKYMHDELWQTKVWPGYIADARNAALSAIVNARAKAKAPRKNHSE